MKTTTANRTIDDVSSHVVSALADHTDTDPLAMEPLNNVVDVDALATLVGSGTDIEITFTYDGHDVLVNGDSTVVVDDQVYDAKQNLEV